MGVIDDCAYGVASAFAYVTIPYDFNVGEFFGVVYSLVPNLMENIWLFGYCKFE